MTKLKRAKDITVGAVLGGMLFSGVSYAASATSINVNFLPLKYFFDGIEKKAPQDQQGFVYQGTTYVPLRFAAEALGKKVGYDGPTSSIYVGKQKEGSFTYIEDMKPFSNAGDDGNIISEFQTNTGIKYYHGYELDFNSGEYGGSSDDRYGWGFEKEYLLNGQFSSFQGLLVSGEQWGTAPEQTDFAGSLEVIVDDKPIYKSGNVASNIISPIDVNIDLKGAIKMKVIFKTNGAYHSAHGGFALVDAKFFNE